MSEGAIVTINGVERKSDTLLDVRRPHQSCKFDSRSLRCLQRGRNGSTRRSATLILQQCTGTGNPPAIVLNHLLSLRIMLIVLLCRTGPCTVTTARCDSHRFILYSPVIRHVSGLVCRPSLRRRGYDSLSPQAPLHIPPKSRSTPIC